MCRQDDSSNLLQSFGAPRGQEFNTKACWSNYKWPMTWRLISLEEGYDHGSEIVTPLFLGRSERISPIPLWLGKCLSFNVKNVQHLKENHILYLEKVKDQYYELDNVVALEKFLQRDKSIETRVLRIYIIYLMKKFSTS
jgi:hypothetical protein